MIRDGGSLTAVFQRSNGSEYWRFFKINLNELPSGQTERLGYLNPVVVDRLVGNAMPVSWQHATVLLHQISSLLPEDRDRKWLRAMETTAANLGQLPREVDRLLGV
jgi:putative addiction module component (TIGR02574 family)